MSKLFINIVFLIKKAICKLGSRTFRSLISRRTFRTGLFAPDISLRTFGTGHFAPFPFYMDISHPPILHGHFAPSHFTPIFRSIRFEIFTIYPNLDLNFSNLNLFWIINHKNFCKNYLERKIGGCEMSV